MILLTGTTGLVGSYIALHLVEKGIPFKAMKRASSSIPKILQPYKDINWVDADILDVVALESVFVDVDTVIHGAAIVSFYKKDFDDMWETNVQGTLNMVNLSLTHNVKRFVHISSIAALGRNGDEGIINEDSKWTKSSNNSVYAETKYQAELEVWRGREEGLSVVIVNPSTVLGPSDWNTSSTRIFKYVWEENKYFPDGFLNYVDVRDAAEVIVQMLNSKADGERYIVNNDKIKFLDIFLMIANAFKKKPPTTQIKPWISALAVKVERLRSFFTGSKPLITKETSRLSSTNYTYKNQKIKTLLNFEFRPVEDTIVWACGELSGMYPKA